MIGGGTLVLQQIQAHADAGGDIDWLVRIDSTILQARQHAAIGRKGETSLVAPGTAIRNDVLVTVAALDTMDLALPPRRPAASSR
ncbi:hypothetical protein DKT74_31870 [Streptomyces sp. ZEA17I]|nr:hypothetical protein DKT74_31870 [Streptomyces sp. ZEA17I]